MGDSHTEYVANLFKIATLKKIKNWFSRPICLMQVKSIAEWGAH